MEVLAQPVQEVRWNSGRGLIEGVDELKIGNLVVSSKRLSSITAENKAKVICDAIQANGIKMLSIAESVREFQDRMACLRVWRKVETWPDISDEFLIQTVYDWLPPFLNQVNSLNELQKLDWYTILKSFIPWELQTKLDELAPQRLEVPSGSMIKIHYKPDGGQPVMEVRLQECFGLMETPTVNEGRVNDKFKLSNNNTPPGK